MACRATNKIRHKSKLAAVNAAFRLLAREVGRSTRPLGAYRCDACGDWHIGHRPKVLPAKQEPRQRQPQAAPAPKPLVQQEPQPLKCWCACRKPAQHIVWTPGGEVAVCGKHATTLRATYQQPEAADGD